MIGFRQMAVENKPESKPGIALSSDTDIIVQLGLKSTRTLIAQLNECSITVTQKLRDLIRDGKLPLLPTRGGATLSIVDAKVEKPTPLTEIIEAAKTEGYHNCPAEAAFELPTIRKFGGFLFFAADQVTDADGNAHIITFINIKSRSTQKVVPALHAVRASSPGLVFGPDDKIKLIFSK